MIKTANLCKVYRQGDAEVQAVNDVSLEIMEGEFVSIVGRSGAGKTTLLSLIGGLTRPSSGRVYVRGTDIFSLSDARLSHLRNETIGFVFQQASLIPTLNALENVMLPNIFREKRGDSKAKALELLELLGLREKAGNYPSQLSGGELRRVAIARALINKPQIILADEPTGDLDEETEGEVISLFKHLNLKWGITMVMVTHSRALAEHSQSILTMSKGKIFKEGGD